MDISTHQPDNMPDQAGANLYLTDPVLESLLSAYLPDELLNHLRPYLRRLGTLVGGRLNELASLADKNPPQLQVRTRTGKDEERILKHPAYIEMENHAFSDFALAAISHRQDVLGWKGQLPPMVKYLLTYLFTQAEFSLMCPVSMTDSLSRTLKKYAPSELIESYLPQLTSVEPDRRMQGAMFMTEQGAGSDIGATTTLAIPTGETYKIYGDKWFCSNPDAGAVMLLARIEGAIEGIKGVSLFFMPRILPDGTPNAYRIIRLKDKLGTRAMASGEIHLEGATAWLMGEPGRGFAQMADMVNNSRLSNGVRAAGLMRRAVSEAFYIARHRQAFGKTLIELPLMRRQLLKILLPSEQARSMIFQTAEVLKRSDKGDANAYSLLRILTPLIKFRACRDARTVTADAMEVRGGCGYIEEWDDARRVRESMLGSIWEGTSNIVALDVRRAIIREHSLDALQTYLDGLMTQTTMSDSLRNQFITVQQRVFALARHAAEKEGEYLTRQAASGLYNLVSATAIAWEASRINMPTRLHLAELILTHRLLAVDPLDKNLGLSAATEALLLAAG
ncbi:acyl-CoA dehydrogenase family protein [Rouxiella sp. Mn2063]|uniref:acyl-CoA dehydrogenase family protein n=1 Tax=Rouxiella sp. Mn2063 TaxID=3395262 RepID=UPI003BD9407D